MINIAIYNVKKGTRKHLKLCTAINALDNLTKKAVLNLPKTLVAHILERITSAMLFTVLKKGHYRFR